MAALLEKAKKTARLCCRTGTGPGEKLNGGQYSSEKVKPSVASFLPTPTGRKPKTDRTPQLVTKNCCLRGTLCKKGVSSHPVARRGGTLKWRWVQISYALSKSRTWNPETLTNLGTGRKAWMPPPPLPPFGTKVENHPSNVPMYVLPGQVQRVWMKR